MKKYGIRLPRAEEIISATNERKFAWMRLRQKQKQLIEYAARPRLKGRWVKNRGRWLTSEEMAALKQNA